MAGSMCMAIVFLIASMVVQADQCASGGECPSSDEPKNVASLLQMQLQMNVFKNDVQEASYDTAKAMVRPACAERKLVINSHVKYAKALDHLVASLKQHNFPLNDCVVFRGGAKASDQLGPRIGPDGITFVDLTLNSYDLTAFSGLSRYNNHSLVCADMYFYIHDTTQIGPCFPKVFAEITVSPTEVITPGKTNEIFANQCAFGRAVVDKFGDDFEDPVDEVQGLLIEKGGCVGKACSIDHYAGKRTIIPNRVGLGMIDMYHTSSKRFASWYQEWDLYKFQHTHSVLSEFGGLSLSQLHSEYLEEQDYEWAPSCPRKCRVEGSDSPQCKRLRT